MLLPVERLIDGVMETLEREVAPGLATPFARGQLFAALDVLANLRDRVEAKAALAEADATAAAEALSAAAPRLREAGADEAARAAERALVTAPSGPSTARAAALREAVSAALADAAEVPAAHDALRLYLVGQAVRDVLPLKRSRLSEIAKGS